MPSSPFEEGVLGVGPDFRRPARHEALDQFVMLELGSLFGLTLSAEGRGNYVRTG